MFDSTKSQHETPLYIRWWVIYYVQWHFEWQVGFEMEVPNQNFWKLHCVQE